MRTANPQLRRTRSLVAEADGPLGAVLLTGSGTGFVLRRDLLDDHETVTLVVAVEDIRGERVTAAVALAGRGIDPYFHAPLLSKTSGRLFT